MKLLLIGSASIHTSNFYNLIKDYFTHVELVSDEVNERCPELRHHLLEFSLKSPLKFYRSIQKLRKILKDYRPDILHIQEAGTGALMGLRAAKGMNIPTVVTAWGSDILVVPQRNFLYKAQARYILSHADYYTSDSSFMAEEMCRIAGRKLNIEVANFGIDIPENIDLSKKENIIYSNRLHKPLYRIDQVLKIFKQFIENDGRSDWKLIVAATGSETENLKALSENLGIADKVEFVGWINKEENISNYLKSKYFISIPESDATSISLLEAMAYGCIPVVSDLPANREWIQNNKNGIIAEEFNGEVLANALNLNYEDVCNFNFNIARNKASKPSNKAIFVSIYDKLLKR